MLTECDQQICCFYHWIGLCLDPIGSPVDPYKRSAEQNLQSLGQCGHECLYAGTNH